MVYFILIVTLILAGFMFIVYYIRIRTVYLAEKLNGRLNELLETTKKLAHDKGFTEGREFRN